MRVGPLVFVFEMSVCACVNLGVRAFVCVRVHARARVCVRGCVCG